MYETNQNIETFADKLECELSPCENNGTCINTLGSYTCNCTEGWQNEDCKDGITCISYKIHNNWENKYF